MSKLHYIFASVILVAAAMLIPLTSGCERAKNAEPSLDVTIHWDVSKDTENNIPQIEIIRDGEYCESQGIRYCDKVVDGKKYFGFVVYYNSAEDKRAPEAVVSEFFIRRLRTPKENIDIHLSCKVSVRLDIVDFEDGILANVDDGKKIAKPFIFTPGTYHLQAFKE